MSIQINKRVSLPMAIMQRSVDCVDKVFVRVPGNELGHGGFS